jgi:uncharacterized membrane protein YkoI
MKTLQLYSLVAAALIPVGIMSAVGQTANTKSLTMIEIVQQLEKDGYGPFSELSMDDGNWEVEVRKQGESVELTVDPINGKVLSEHRDDAEQTPGRDAMALSTLLQIVSDNGGYKNFDEVSFERRYWEIEVYKNGQKRELHVDPRTAKVVADRLDD